MANGLRRRLICYNSYELEGVIKDTLMNAFRGQPGKQSRRVSRNHFVTKSGKVIKVHRSLAERVIARKDERAQRKAKRLAGLPKTRLKRFFYRLQPRHLAKYWFSRDGAIMALKVLGIGFAVGFLLLIGVFAYFRKDLPNLKDISGSNIGGSMRYYDRSGQTLLWEDYDAVKRIPVKDTEISQYVKDATVAVEDKDFFKHGGFDTRGIIRAGWNNFFGNSGTTQGGSTITQQLVKLTQNWSRDRSYTRKVKELILSVELERTYTKQEILTGYLNTAPYGGIEYGVEAAARDYFDKSAKDLTLEEAAMLATIPKSPRYYSPYSADFDKEAFASRQQYVLELMHQQGKITQDQLDQAKKTDVVALVKPRKPKYDGIKAPWFVLAAKKQLEDKFGNQTVQRGGWNVTTTLDLDKQKIAEEEVNKGMAQVRRQGGDTAAFVGEDVKTGQVVALVGGSDFSNPDFGQFNYATAQLPPGSSFKPYDYVSLIEHTNNSGAGSVLYDTQGPLEGYPCTNKAQPKQGGNCLWDYDFKYPGPLTLRYALGGSRNVPAVKAMLTVGINKTIDTAEKLGLKSGYKCYYDDKLTKEGPCYASSAIGDGAYLHLDEHVHAYSTISRNGQYIPQTYILKITDAGGKKVDEWKPSKGEQAVRPDAAYIVADMMADPNASYFSKKPHRYKNHKFSLKTGTTNDTKDGLLMGFSTQYSAGVWVGYHTRQREMRGFMETMTEPIWSGWMRRVHDNLKPEERVKPSGVQTLPAFVVRNHVGVGSVEPSPSNDIYPSWYQQNKKTNSAPRVIDKVSNKLATECTPDRAKMQTNDAAANSFSGDRFVPGGSASTTTDEKDDVHKCGDARPQISFVGAPANCAGSCTFTLNVSQGTHPLSSDKFKGTVNLVIDGQVVQTTSVGSPGTVTLTYAVATSGNKQVRAEIIDSVLYDGSDTVSVDFAGGGSGNPLVITSPASGQGVGPSSPFNVSWAGGTSPYTLTVNGPGGTCFNSSVGGTSQTVPGCIGNGNYTATVIASGGPSASVMFKRP